MQSIRPDRAILSAQRKQRIVAPQTPRMEVSRKRGEIFPPWAPGTLEREKRVWLMDGSEETGRQASSWPARLQRLSPLQTRPAVRPHRGRRMDVMWEFAICGNFIFSCHSRESQCLTGSGIAVISYIFAAFPYHRLCRSLEWTPSVSCLENQPKPNSDSRQCGCCERLTLTVTVISPPPATQGLLDSTSIRSAAVTQVWGLALVITSTGANLCYHVTQSCTACANENSKTCPTDRVGVLCFIKALNHLFIASFVLFPSSPPLFTFRSAYMDKNTKWW